MSTALDLKRRPETVLTQCNQLLEINQSLIQSKIRFDAQGVSGYQKLLQSQSKHKQIINNFDAMSASLKNARLQVAREYQRLKGQPHAKAQLEQLAETSKKLRKLASQVEVAKSIYLSPKAPKASPLASILPSVPTHKVILDQKTLALFVKISLEKGWNAAEKVMQQYVAKQPHNVKLSSVKEQVCDELIKLKHADVFGQAPQDKSFNRPRMGK